MEIYTTVIFSIILYVIAEKCINYLKILSEFLAIHDLYEFHAIFTENTTYIVTGKIEVLSEKNKNTKSVIKNNTITKTLYFKNCVGFKSHLTINELIKFHFKKAIFIYDD
jgi:hypothetical protein